MHEIEIELNVPVPMRDGTVLRADIYRPAGNGSWPVLLNRTPYDKSRLYEGLLDFKKAVRAGYIVVYQDTRGRFASEGDWMPWKYERADGYDTVEWAASLPSSSGRVGMFGASYMGGTQWSAAIARPPHLISIAPHVTWSDPEDGLLFRGGAIELGLNGFWSLVTALGQYPKTALDLEEVTAKTLETVHALDSMATKGYWDLPAGALPSILATGQPDIGIARAFADPATIDEARVANRYDEIDLPSITFAGWYDVFLQGALDNYVGMRSRGRTARLVVGPWAHMGIVDPPLGGQVGGTNFGAFALAPGGRSITDVQLEWYDHWLAGRPETTAHQSGVLIFVMGTNQWRWETDWPLTRARDTPLYLNDGSSLTWTSPDVGDAASSYAYDPADPVITHGGNVIMTTEYPAGPFDQRAQEERADVLVFSTEPLKGDLEITGRVRATIYAATDGTSTDWVVRLCDVDEHGISRNVVDGITRVRTAPGRVDEVRVDLWSTSLVIPAGHRLRVHVTSSNFPRWDRNLNTGQPENEARIMRVASQTIFHDRNRPSHVLLPIVADRAPGFGDGFVLVDKSECSLDRSSVVA